MIVEALEYVIFKREPWGDVPRIVTIDLGPEPPKHMERPYLDNPYVRHSGRAEGRDG